MLHRTMNRVERPALSLRLAGVALLAAACCLAGTQAGPRPADMVLVNGAILVFNGIEQKVTADPDGGPARGAPRTAAVRSDAHGERPRFVQALAVVDGRIVFTGPSGDAKRYVGPKTQLIDLEGRMVMPGIVDGHFHGTRSTDCEMGYAGGTIAQVLAKLQACLDRPEQAAFKGTNVRFFANHIFGEAIEPPGTALTRADLDRLETTRPVMVENADGHKFWMNSKAISNAGFNEKTPDPPEGSIGRDAQRKPSGFFADLDPGEWGQKAPVTEASLLEQVRRTNADANRMGLTSVFIPGEGEKEIADWARLQDEGKLTLRVNVGLSAGFVRGNGDVADLRRKIAALDDYKKYARGLIDVTSVKVYCDGVMEYPAQTAAMLKPYGVNAGTADKPVWRPGTARGPEPSCSDAKAGFVELDRAGWQIHVHAIGDRATRDALDDFQAALAANGAHDRRHTITHLEAIDAADVPRFKTLGVIPSMSLQWARRDGYTVTGTIGSIDEALYTRLFPAAELWRAGAVIAGGSDYPVDPLRPFSQIETAITHTGEAIPGVLPGALSPTEVIPDLLAVIKMHTINSAYQMHQEKNFGSIETGKYADLIVLSQNLFAIPTGKISDTKVLLTVQGGKVVYRDAETRLGAPAAPQATLAPG
ncbi:MAG TPA: amidohydrolase family protein [Candidatus Polarisedimenticolia bacterium]|nr:amidohydrolase family protein [Candidatus Polarisedimenticolia bacterium]